MKIEIAVMIVLANLLLLTLPSNVLADDPPIIRVVDTTITGAGQIRFFNPWRYSIAPAWRDPLVIDSNPVGLSFASHWNDFNPDPAATLHVEVYFTYSLEVINLNMRYFYQSCGKGFWYTVNPGQSYSWPVDDNGNPISIGFFQNHEFSRALMEPQPQGTFDITYFIYWYWELNGQWHYVGCNRLHDERTMPVFFSVA